ncbi:MAG: VOC family protein [Syntrophomonadaceae bacterium]|nr:VOC family protein [Syntrophomonadaceae bacterium]
MKFAHTNIIARDWKKLARFYIDVFACQPTYPERDLSGEWIDQATDIGRVHIRGIHLRLPGYTDAPTLEIFQYEPDRLSEVQPAINGQGLGHIAFEVDSVEEVLHKLLAHGGTRVGELVKKEYPGVGWLTMVYTRDPEGNIIEIQNWQK